MLGSFDVTLGTCNITPTAPRLRQILALLVVQSGRTVTLSELIDEMWGDDPPVSAQSTLQTYIYKLRKSLEASGLESSEVLRTRPNGYALQVPDDCIDLRLFDRAVAEGRRVLTEAPDKALGHLKEGLELWRGPALTDVSTGEVLAAHTARLHADHLSALELKIEADLKLGNHRTVVPELTSLSTAHPLHEGFHSLLMHALHCSGRRSEALQVYNRLRRDLVEELGLEPSPLLQRAQQAILSGEPQLGAGSPLEAPAQQPRAAIAVKREPAPVRPGQLPPDPGPLVGRDSLTESAIRVAGGAESADENVGVLLLNGMPGVGKSALAARIAHAVRDRFTGGQLYVDLRGSRSRPTSPDDALTGFLRAAGIPEPYPQSLDEKSSLFRSWGAERDMLLLLDDAQTHSQVNPLLLGGTHSFTIITSRVNLYNLPNAETFEINSLDPAESFQLLAKIVGRKRAEAERDSVELIAEMCGHLPLALRCAGARLATLQSVPIRRFAESLYRDNRPLDQLQSADVSIRDRYLATYDRLGSRERAVLRLLTLLRQREFTAATLIGLLGCTEAVAESALSTLVEHHFLRTVPSPGGETVYSFHELMRAFCRERMESELSAPPAREPLADAS
ncbi:AfsR/SARP family transcriptional regulator [Streptomyces sp. Amel2xB2]|uniref:AfsR/SARP family transcriptional regulator n=1 Tax=Streptomyces sp. Amel2xB2 TaxID=1305829 RepID=UPI0021ACEB73|nr:AfsR/SARP family transcriptional regulator [Streptomyces sp. Amel2xB2]